jgi:hypothetical protein
MYNQWVTKGAPLYGKYAADCKWIADIRTQTIHGFGWECRQTPSLQSADRLDNSLLKRVLNHTFLRAVH